MIAESAVHRRNGLVAMLGKRSLALAASPMLCDWRSPALVLGAIVLAYGIWI